jgi:very-short-patch-repair endonuclease
VREESAITTVNRAIAAVAARQFGVITFAQLIEAGLSRTSISRWVQSRRLYRLHQGVYSAIPPELLAVQGHWRAAVLALGDGAGLADLAAAAHWDMIRPPSGPIHVIVPGGGGRRRRRGIIVHRSSTLLPHEIVMRNGIPVTTPTRTLADLRRRLPDYRFAPILRRAEKLRLDTGQQAGMEDPDRTELERRFLALCRRHSLPSPDCQVIIGPYTVDFLWPEVGLIVEVDGWEDHGTRSAFESDRERDAWLVAAGYRVVRFTWRQVNSEGPEVARVIRAILQP